MVVDVVILFLYQIEDYGKFGDSKIRAFLRNPAWKAYDIIPLSVGTLTPAQRFPTIKKWMDRTDFLLIGQGGHTFIRRWARNSGIYGFQKNMPMLSVDSSAINEGWSVEAIIGPSPFLYLMWKKQGKYLTVYNSSYVFDHVWRRQFSVPISTVRYRLEGEQGLFDEFAPVFRWNSESDNKEIPVYIERALYLSGEAG